MPLIRSIRSHIIGAGRSPDAGGKGTVAHYVSTYRALIGAAPTGV